MLIENRIRVHDRNRKKMILRNQVFPEKQVKLLNFAEAQYEL